jgi:hypothetical protein
MKGRLYSYGLGFSGLFFVFLYFVFNHFIIAVMFAIPFVFLVYYSIIPLIIKIKLQSSKNDNLYFLVNTVLTQLRTDKSLTVAFKSIVNYIPEEIRNNYETYGVSPIEFLDMMKAYFNSKYYEIFFNMIKINDTKGGDIEERSRLLIDAISFSKEVSNQLINIKLRKLSEFIIMWLLAFLVLLYLRFGLTAYYINLLSTNFIFAIIGNFILFILSSYYAIVSFNKLEESIR